MQPFKQFFSEREDNLDRQPSSELSKPHAKQKIKDLLNLVDQINKAVDAAQHEIEAQTYTRDEAEALKHKISQLSQDLEGTRLPPEAEGKLGPAYTSLQRLPVRDSVETAIKEAVRILGDLLSK